MEQVARWKRDIDEAEFATVVNSAGIQIGQLTWSYSIVKKKLRTFIKNWLTGKARKAFSSSEHGGFDSYRRLIGEIDPINHRTSAAMIDSIIAMVQKGTSQKCRVLKTKLIDLEIMVKNY